ncbi:MAG: tyrosine-type recombinase/integrase [Epsilonproteobacteria bacterium]|nr:tyrosine-type recombinase/integrase [Campylobacterota bacterium]
MISLKENINIFLNYLDKNRGYAVSSLKTYRTALFEMEQVSHFYQEDDKTILDITPFRLKIVNNSKKTISKKLSSVRSLVKFLKEQKKLEIIVIGDSTIKVPKTLPKPIDENIIEEVLEYANQEQKIIIVLLYGLGLRISELSELKIKNISTNWVKVLGKGNKEREIPLISKVAQQIDFYLKNSNPKEFLLEKEDKQMSVHQIRYLLNKLFRSRGIKATPHQLRHSFATHLLNSGARIADVSKLLGHSSMVSTQIYTKLENSKKLKEYSKAHPLCDL